jgi:uncharacterized protein (TIGR02118 family)
LLKFVVVLYRRSDWDEARFRRHFADVHAPLARHLPGLTKYIQNFPAEDANRSKPRWSAVIELYFDDYDSMQRAWNSPQGKRATDDLKVFADLSLSSWSVVEPIEHHP